MPQLNLTSGDSMSLGKEGANYVYYHAQEQEICTMVGW